MPRLRYLVILVIFTFFLTAGEAKTFAQYPSVTAYRPVVPATVSYVPMRRGLFGRRTVYRPVITPLPATTTVISAPPATQTIVTARPVVEAYPVAPATPIPTAAPAITPVPTVAPTTRPIPKVSAYYTPMQPTRVPSPVPQYVVPVVPAVPVVGY